MPVELEVWDDMFHVWHAFAPVLPEGRQALDKAGEFIKKHTGGLSDDLRLQDVHTQARRDS